MDGIASAVVLPDQDVDSPPPTAASPTGTKRRQSSISEQDAKRVRLNGNGSPTDRRESVSSTKAAATAPKGRERGRERRLFGAALGALSQNSATTGQKRRLEIEKRQRAQRKLEEEESEHRKQERQAKRKAQRWREHRRFEKDSLRIRHDNLLAMAHFLHTRTEPRLYYKPWETTPEEDERIRDQIAEAHDIVQREREDFEAKQRQYAGRERDANRDMHMDGDAEDTRSGKEYSEKAPAEPAAANGHPTNGSETSKNPEQNGDHAQTREGGVTSLEQDSTTGHERSTDDTYKEAMDDHGEEVVEAAEDTVMY
ncbi:uncharacterized protein CC84DRAFT_1222984 [Paraphaeosphaeria sporulosa]|uniref:Pinin/SDK/MemA protein domain-containing protein n=1 Tax=Paraphaeosphaeria sporulosa TaxID=1460663 RepID=A0A177BX72_9PLEO|nr:uncharacterized protein CC84DRAFT_1222984 [Paraphaeosphaeria sporulosa]OAF99291.1 hypothetical protein CC84DRAFT_1222984 [Paraphaeosphaeria sporulosa]